MFKDKKLVRFIISCLLIYLFWVLVYDLWLKPVGEVDFWLTSLVAKHSASGLELLGYDAYSSSEGSRQVIMNDKGRILVISNACNGLILYPLFIGFIVAIPGKLKNMFIMIVTGSVGIYLINIIRAVILCLIQLHVPQFLDFNHKYTFVIIVYSFIFFLWFIWINRFSQVKVAPK